MTDLGRNLRLLIRQFFENFYTLLPGKVLQWDGKRRRHQVQLKIRRRFNNDEDREVDGPAPFDRPDVHWRSETFLTRFPQDDKTPALLGFLQREDSETVRDMEQRVPESKRISHPQDGIIMGNVRADDDDTDPINFQNDYILVLNRKTGHYIRMTEKGDIFIYGRRVCTYSDQGGCPSSPPQAEYE